MERVYEMDRSKLIQIDEAETLALIKMSTRELVLPLKFGANKVYIDYEMADKSFIHKIAEMRGLLE